jgi:hypothetical protein
VRKTDDENRKSERRIRQPRFFNWKTGSLETHTICK